MLRLAPALAMGILIVPVAAGLVGVLLPAFGVLPALGGSEPGLEPWRQLAAQPGISRSVGVSYVAGLLTGAAALAVTFLFLAGFAGTRSFNWVRRSVSPLLSVPHAAAAFGFAYLIAPSGLIARLLSPWATGWTRPPDLLIVNDPWGWSMMAALTAKEVPFLLLMCLAALPQVDAPARLMVARTLGYRPVAAWLKVVAPALYPLIRLPVYAVIAYSTAVVDVALILGPTNPPTLSVAVIRWLNDPELSMRFMASAGAVLQLLTTLAALATWWLAEQLVGALSRRWYESGRRALADRLLAGVGGGGMVFAVLSAALGLFSLGVWSFAGQWRFPDVWPQTVGFATWQRYAPALIDPLVATLLVGLLSTAASLVIVIGALENETRRGRPASEVATAILYLPLVVPPVAFLFGLIIGAEVVGIRPGFWPVVLGHIVFVLPYVYLSLVEAYRRLDPRYAMLARTLGASPARIFWTVRMPLLLTPCLTAAAVGFAVSVGQYLATQLLGAGRLPTVTTEAVALASGGDRRVIGVWALVQALLPALGFALALAIPRLIWRNRRQMLEAR